MKKQLASRRLLMWVMVHLSISGVLSKSNHTTTSVVCDGSVEDCLNVHHLDSQLPTISSTHFRRILAGVINPVTALTNNPATSAGCPSSHGYVKCGAATGSGQDSRCADKNAYYKPCHYIQ
ncbi:uncharacterized protein LOC114395833 [Glycine soja]|uniref:Uncharacterized protein n=1 Tax=Glycine soja TaxID=3848 RepID=A0A445FY94_GLYSO|nr:uncharacterized protein LOC114395833 [Glycine soja]RZB53900.1 hypothetical protein D0Y65_049712 [Glycine soja]